MALLDAVRKAATAAFTAASDFAPDVVYVSQPNSTYTPTTGTVSQSGTEMTVSAFLVRAKSTEVDNQAILANDMWMLVLNDALGTVTPEEGDEVRAEELTYRVVGVQPVVQSGRVMWKLQLRIGK